MAKRLKPLPDCAPTMRVFAILLGMACHWGSSEAQSGSATAPELLGNSPPRIAPIRASTQIARPHPALLLAHQQLSDQDYGAAGESLRKVLDDDRHHVEALIIMAALKERQGLTDAAERLRQQALQLAPTNPQVIAANFSGSRLRAEPLAHESRLRSHISQHRDSAPLHFALANLLAGQYRWDEAQAEYLRATALDGSNPDYLFNLAISLDQQRQYQQASDYYRQSLIATAHRAASYDRRELQRRLAELDMLLQKK